MPSPPPPYTPPTPASTLRPPRPPVFATNDHYASSPLVSSFSSMAQSSSRSSPQMQMHAQFPPPPSKDKSSMRPERDSSKSRFGLSALTAMVKRPDMIDSPSQPSSPMFLPVDAPTIPPAGRRAISTGGMSLPSASGSYTQLSRRPSPESAGWEPGMPLPPPPPGPPPSTAGRSQSLNRYAQQRSADVPVMSSDTIRPSASRQTSHTNTLGSIPPTPLGWVDDDPLPHNQSTNSQAADVPQTRASAGTEESPAVPLTRRPAKREPSADGILERRSKSKAGRDAPVSGELAQRDPQSTSTQTSTFRKPANLVLSSTDPLLQRRLAERAHLSPESLRRQNAANSTSTLTPPYTPSPDLHRSNPKRNTIDGSTKAAPESSQDNFAQASLERFHMFIQLEASSPTDKDRLELFANFMVQESRIRRDRYGIAFSSMAGEIMDLTRDMWRPTGSASALPDLRSMKEVLQDTSRPSVSAEDSRGSTNIPTDSSCSSATEFTPATDTESMYGNSEHDEDRPPLTPWGGDRFQPSLSPIRSVPSMAVSTVPDDEDSRGRSASRWWEGSGEGSSGQGGRKLEMTKQESKYMSLHPTELVFPAQPSPSHSTPTPNTTKTAFKYEPDKYPPEKTGLYEEESPGYCLPAQPPSLPLSALPHGGKQPMIPPLDVSRLVTLPPPYPRHYPALHNDHPALSSLRSKHRQIAEVIILRQSRPQTDQLWQTSVYVEMIQMCESGITELATRLDDATDTQQTTSAQTEGDECPELLEQLTLLKWIFEAREQLQKQDFDAAMQQMKGRSQASVDYWQSVCNYQQQKAESERLTQQLQLNQVYYGEQATKRYGQLLDIVERHVNRGVEVQLSAFWDIAPALLEIVQKIPIHDAYSLANFYVLVPSKEFADNPSYRQFPLQYLLQTLTHAKKSAYQFIESQTNLLCLLHEVRTASMSTEIRLSEIKRIMKGEDTEWVRQEMAEIRRQREDEETGVLKERVGCLEGQWESALGEEIEKVVEAVQRFLEDQGAGEDGSGAE